MNTVLIIIASIIIIVIVLVALARYKFKNMPIADPHEDIIILNEKNFNQRLKNKLVLVDFWAAWCAPCRVMLPTLNDVAASSDGSYLVGKVDIDKNQALAQKLQIRSIPTLVVFRNGKEVARYVGIKTKSFLIDELKKL